MSAPIALSIVSRQARRLGLVAEKTAWDAVAEDMNGLADILMGRE